MPDPEQLEHDMRQTISFLSILVTVGVLACSAAAQTLPSTRVFDQPFAANELIGRNVVNPQGEDIATIADLLLDENGTLRQVVLDIGGFLGIGSRPVAVDVNRLQPGGEGRDAFVLSLSRDELAALPAWDAEQWRTRR